MTLPRPTPQPTPPLWRNRLFVVWLLAATQSRFGSALSAVALSFLVLEETGDAGALSLTLALAFLPALLMPLAGAWVDRLPPKLPLVVADALSGVVQLGLGALALAGVLGTGWLYAAAFVGGLVGAVATPAAQGAVPRLVPAEALARANGLLASGRQAALLAGFAVGGVLVAGLGAPAALLLDGLSYLLSALAVWALVRFPDAPPTNAPAHKVKLGALWADFLAGWATLQGSPNLRVLPAFFLLLNAAYAPLQVLVPAEMQRLGLGAGGYSAFLMAQMVGGLLAGALLAWRGERLPARPSVAAGFALAAAGLLALALSTDHALPAYVLPAYILGGACIGFGLGVSGTVLQTLVGQATPQAALGRVFGLIGALGMAGMPLTLLLLAPLAGSASFGNAAAAAWLYGGAAATVLALAVAWAWVGRSLPVGG